MSRRKVQLSIMVVTVLLLSVTVRAEELARLFDSGTAVYVELNSGARGMQVVEAWLGPMAKGGENPLQSGYKELADLMGIAREQVPDELKKVNGAAVGVIGANADAGEPMLLFVVDTGTSAALVAALKTALGIEKAVEAETFMDVPVYKGENIECPGATDGEGFCAFDGSLFILGPSLEAVKSVIARHKAAADNKPALSSDPDFQAGMAKLDKDRVTTMYFSPVRFKAILDVAGKDNEEIGKVWKAMDLESMEFAVGQMVLKGEKSIETAYAKFKPGSHVLAAVRTPTGAKPLLKRVPSDFPIVFAFGLEDGKGHYQRFVEYVKGVQAATGDSDFKEMIDSVEGLGVNLGEEVGNVSQVVFAVKPPTEATAGKASWLGVLETLDPVKTAALSDKLEKHYLESAGQNAQIKTVEYMGIKIHYPEQDGKPVEDGLCYALDANVWMIANNRQILIDAIKAAGVKKSILDTPVYVQAMESLPTPNSKLLLLDVIGLAASDFTLPGGVKAGRAVVAVVTVEGPDEITVTADVSGMARLLPLMLMMMGNEEGGEVEMQVE